MAKPLTLHGPTVAEEIARLQGWIEANSLALTSAHMDLKARDWADAGLARKCMTLARMLSQARQRLAALLVLRAPKKV